MKIIFRNDKSFNSACHHLSSHGIDFERHDARNEIRCGSDGEIIIEGRIDWTEYEAFEEASQTHDGD